MLYKVCANQEIKTLCFIYEGSILLLNSDKRLKEILTVNRVFLTMINFKV